MTDPDSLKDTSIRFSYWIGERDLQIQPETGMWCDAFPIQPNAGSSVTAITYGDYFEGVRAFLIQNDGIRIHHALNRLFEAPRSFQDIDAIDIHLIKHGEFYHPGRVDIHLSGKRVSFLVNVALSKPGMATAQNEFRLLERLSQTGCGQFLPEVFDLKKIGLPSGMALWIFSAEWLHGFHEWHLLRNPSDGKTGIVVWDSEQGHRWLSPHQSGMVYHRIAEILTCFYRLETGNQIFPWHHAAGDFIVRTDADRVDVRLITVRQYHSMMDMEMDSPEDVFLSIMLCLCNLSIRTRLDRQDGTGDYIWADSSVIPFTVAGFMDGLRKKEPVPFLPKHPADCFLEYVHAVTRDDMDQLCRAIVDSYNPRAPEIPLIHRQLSDHVTLLSHALTRLAG
ncbi:MAG: hypothetical protein WA151_24035 [Desulfatirhabdiaceae bacterium]